MLEGKEVVARVGVGVFVFKSRDDRRFSMGLRKGSISAGKSLPVLAWSPELELARVAYFDRA